MKTIMLCAAVLALPAAAVAQPVTEAGSLVGSQRVDAGTWAPAQPLNQIRIAEGPYEPTTTFGVGETLNPHPIIYKGKFLAGIPNSPFPVPVKLEFCEQSSMREALRSLSCPAAFVVADRDVEFDENLEVLVKMPKDRWFNPDKLYVLIWRREVDTPVIGFSSPFKVAPRSSQ